MKILYIKIVFTSVFLFFMLLFSRAQNPKNYIPKVGDTVMDYTFTDVINYQKKKVSISDFRGKWLMLDWWANGCVGCIQSFPKIDKISRDFAGRLQVMLIGLYYQKPGTANHRSKELFAALSKKHHLTLPVAFDSASIDDFKLRAVPLILVIDPQGVIRSKTYSIDSLKLTKVMAGEALREDNAFSEGEKGSDSVYNYKLPLLATGKMANGGIDTSVIFRSVLTKWNPGQIQGYYGFVKRINLLPKNWAEILGFDLPSFLRIAYTGSNNWSEADTLRTTFNPEVIVELKDTALFAKMNGVTGENAYSYSLIGQNLSYEARRQHLLRDLESTFRFKSRLELRNASVWKLVLLDISRFQRFRSKSKVPSYDVDPILNSYSIKNMPIEVFMQDLYKFVLFAYQKENDPIMINSTGQSFNIDATIKSSYFEFDQMRKELQVMGLDLIKSEIPMRTIVVKEVDNL